MKKTFIVFIFVLIVGTTVRAEVKFANYGEYCAAMANMSVPTLIGRNRGMSKSEIQKGMSFMTDPESIRMVNEVIDFAFSRPITTDVSKLEKELVTLCKKRKIFVQ